ncbi:MAG: hydroxymethylglutaryl-CoA synthase [Gammaproteobacteria bacterium RIFCSPHIGHO2_12_FULL_37_14]|nr:MAG: hydroxymethylglutaryl-CoA synthase [Gammaproteobacteria bacterium RIFCSPHIGHO2_12_FULL_37_14]
MHKVGIDSLAIYTSRYLLDLAILAEARGADPDKYRSQLGQQAMSVPPPGEDIVTMAANAAKQVLMNENLDQFTMLLFATESGIDQSKAAGIYVHHLLGLSSHCRVMEFKQACYGATAALQLAMSYLRENPTKKVLLIASDIARYELHSAAESSQGAGAIALILSANPRVLALESEYGVVTEDVMDFWRPNYLHHALVDGKYSSKLYLTMLEKSWHHYCESSGRNFLDHDAFCYHVPVPRLVENAHRHLLKFNNQVNQLDNFFPYLQSSLEYGRKIGNSYTAALYVALASLLDLSEDLTNKRIGFYSYGSGCVAEYFSGIVQAGYRQALHTIYHTNLLAHRTPLSYQNYEMFYSFQYPEDGSTVEMPNYHTGSFRIANLQNHKRNYERNPQLNVSQGNDQKNEDENISYLHVDKKVQGVL